MSWPIKNILIRGLTGEDNEIISVLMGETGCNQASKAVMRAVYSFIRSQALIKQQTSRIKAGSGEPDITTECSFNNQCGEDT